MGDVQEYFIKEKVRNFYSVSISGYHIAEAGANPVSQLAFTLANGFTYVEYYLSEEWTSMILHRTYLSSSPTVSTLNIQ
jgi:methylmalonyl-CoA mutase N-terminal domain/subunit